MSLEGKTMSSIPDLVISFFLYEGLNVLTVLFLYVLQLQFGFGIR